MELTRYHRPLVDDQIDSDIEQLFLEIDAAEVARRPIASMDLAHIEDFAKTLACEMERESGLHFEIETTQNASFYLQMSVVETMGGIGRQSVSLRFSLYGTMVSLAVVPGSPGVTIANVERLVDRLQSDGFVVVPWADTQFPYTGLLRSKHGTLLRDSKQPLTWGWRYFDWQ